MTAASLNKGKKVTIWTEGKTDWKHLKRASEELAVALNIDFVQFENSMGGDNLLKKCESHAEIYHSEPTIFVFDRDVPAIISRVTDETRGYKNWGNNVFSIALPIPEHRKDSDEICIEYMYTDNELGLATVEGRKLFFSNEFNTVSGKLRSNPLVSVGNKHNLGKKSKIIDQEVYNENDVNIALSKADFAECIYTRTPPFDSISFLPFKQFFDIIQEVALEAQEKADLFLDGRELFFVRLAEQPFSANVLRELFVELTKIMKLASLIFVAATIRYYENDIAGNQSASNNKSKAIRESISEGFREPSLNVLHKITRNCYYFVDDNAPRELTRIKSCFGEQLTLGSLGFVLNYLEELFPPAPQEVKIRNKPQIRKQYLSFVLKEFARYEARMNDLSDEDFEVLKVPSEEVIQTWRLAIDQLTELFKPFTENTFVTRRIDRIDANSDVFIVSASTYSNGDVTHTEELIKLEDLRSDQYETCELLLSSEIRRSVDLFPFVIIRHGRIHAYRRTRANGYELSAMFTSQGVMFLTKRKFNHFVFRTTTSGDDQLVFWTEVIPSTNPNNGITANIPAETVVGFVGRKKQISAVMDTIIQIPNQNGIIFGPGGVGKTALMVQVTRQLFEESDANRVLFDNIIWVSAKKDYYNPALNVVEKRGQQFKTLDNVFSVLFEFLGYRNMDEYEASERKEFALEVLREHRILLILDNFETISRTEQVAILEFFDTTVKQILRDKPHYFKVVVTSREQIPSGFRQISLKGLEQKESKQLMKKLIEPYHGAREQLTDAQQEELYRVTAGIPIIIKHCYGQIFEYNVPVDNVLRNLSDAGNRVVDFSFAEIFQLVREDEYQLQIIILLEVINCALLLRQISDILEIPETDLAKRIAILANFQCISRGSQAREEKYSVNEDTRIFTRRIAQENTKETQRIRKLVAKNYTIDKSMDYTVDEFNAIVIFNDYVSSSNLLAAEDFLRKELEANPESVFLNYHYARFLRERKNDIPNAISLLESIRVRSNNHPHVLQLLMSYLSSLDVPNYNQAGPYALELKNGVNEEILFDVAEFYVKWSTAIKMRTELDPIREMQRQQEYKELADLALEVLKKVGERGHRYYYLLAQCHYNKWDYDLASNYINSAIALLPSHSYLNEPYNYFKSDISKKRRRYNHGASDYGY